MASSTFHKIRLLFNYVSIILLLALTLFWFFLLIANPELFTHWKTVIAAIISWGTTAYGLFRPRVQKRIQREFPRVIERFGYIAIWMFAIASLIYVSYTLPVHRITLVFHESDAGRLRDPATEVWLRMDVDSLDKSLHPDPNDSLRYPCERRFRFNQDGTITIAEQGGGTRTTEPLWWPDFPIFGLFSTTEIPIRLRPNFVSVHVITGVQSADIYVESEELHFQQEGNFNVRRGSDVHIIVSSPLYQERRYLLVNVCRDTSVNVPMIYEAVNVMFVVRCEDEHIDSAHVRLVDAGGNSRSALSNQPIGLMPGRYEVFIEKPYQSTVKFVVNPYPFTLVVDPGSDTVVDCRATLTPY